MFKIFYYHAAISANSAGQLVGGLIGAALPFGLTLFVFDHLFRERRQKGETSVGVAILALFVFIFSVGVPLMSQQGSLISIMYPLGFVLGVLAGKKSSEKDIKTTTKKK